MRLPRGYELTKYHTFQGQKDKEKRKKGQFPREKDSWDHRLEMTEELSTCNVRILD